MPKIQFYDESFGASTPRTEVGRAFDLDIETLSAAELIRLWVELEFEPPEPGCTFTSEDLRRYAGGLAADERPSLEQAIAEAQKSLTTNAYFLIVNGRQIRRGRDGAWPKCGQPSSNPGAY